MTNLVTYTRSGPISRIVMDDGKVNVMSIDMLEALHAAFDEAERDKTVVVLTGRGKTFSAGFDLKVLASGSSHEIYTMLKAGGELALRVLSFPTPVVVACNGHAYPMGAFLILAADLRLAAQGPHKIGLNEVAIGITVPQFGIEVARQRLTPAYFSRTVMTGEMFAPPEAVTAGFFDRIVPAAELDATADQAAEALSRINLSAHAATKLRARGPTIQAMRAAIDTDITLEYAEERVASRTAVANEEEVLVPISLPPTPRDWKHHLVQDHFGAAARAYTTSKVHASGPDLAWIVEAAALTGKEHVVDVGTGTGHTALALAPYATEVVALDITLPMLEEARHLAASRGVTNVRFLQGDACALPLNSSQFDLVACRYAAHHFTHVAQAIGEWARILKTGGKVVVADSVSPEEPEIDRFLNEIEVLRDPSHGRNYRISEWFSLLAEAGFTASLVRSWTIPLDLASWTQRIQTPPASVAQIERLFADASSLTRERLHIGLNEEGLLSFALPAAVFVGVKPV